MISTKAVIALALSGLGAATVASDAYMMHGGRPHFDVPTPAPPPRHVVPKAEPPPRVIPKDTVVTIDPVFVYARAPVRIAARAKPVRTLVPCSQWRSLESGPAGHGVRQLCIQ